MKGMNHICRISKSGSENRPLIPLDQYADDVAHESKVGYQNLTKRTKRQIQKDAELLETKQIDGATWHFFESPVTGKGGPSKPLIDELNKNDIKIKIHD